VRYFATPSTPRVRDAMRRGLLACIDTPAQGNRLPEGVPWCADNGRFGNGWPGYHRWASWLGRHTRDGCAFAVAPDIPFDAVRTLRLFGPASRLIRRLGFPVAFAAQNGIEQLTVPWDDLDVIFLGGDDAWKLGEAARQLTAEAHGHGIPVHMGRVNTLSRLQYAAWIGCDSADGTYLARGPDKNLPYLLAWLRAIDGQETLFAPGPKLSHG
jgi:hypothetical protein